MAKIPRVTQSIFAGSATNNGQFGSAQAGTFNLTTSLATIMSLPAWASGWLSAVIGGSKFPPLEEFQAIEYVTTTQIAYLLQEGIPEYDTGTTYWANSIVKGPGTFQLFGSLTNSNAGNALPTAPASNSNWQFLIDLSANNSGFTTGDLKPTIKTTADTGWVLCADGTIGSASSGASERANSDTANLYTLLWNNFSNATAPVTGGRGANAAADFAANKPIRVGTFLGRAIGVSGAGSGLTSRALGSIIGDENLQSHTHTVTDPGHAHVEQVFTSGGTGSTPLGNNNGTGAIIPCSTSTASATTGITIASSGTGSGGNMQPTTFVNVMIKL